MKRVIQISGKAKQVFKYMELLNRYQGKTALKDLVKANRTIKLDLRP